MKALYDAIYVAVAERIGNPVLLDRWLETYGAAARPQLIPPPRVVGVERGVAKWHLWAESSASDLPRLSAGVLRGWRKKSGDWTFTHIDCRPLVELCSIKQLVAQIDVRQVEGVSASRSDLNKHTTLDEFISDSRPKLIEKIDATKVLQFLGCEELRILGDEPSDQYNLYAWDGRIFLGNSGGSHRFAAARFIAGKLGLQVALKARLTVHSINPMSISNLRGMFDIYAMSKEAVVLNEFDGAMRSFEAPYFWNELPSPYQAMRAVFLPKAEKRSQLVANRLADAGFFDVGAHILGLANPRLCDLPREIAALL